MALSAGETWDNGEVRDADGRMVVVYATATAGTGLTASESFSNGQVRDPDGRRVVRVGP